MRRWLIDFTVVWWPEIIGFAFAAAIVATVWLEPWSL